MSQSGNSDMELTCRILLRGSLESHSWGREREKVWAEGEVEL